MPNDPETPGGRSDSAEVVRPDAIFGLFDANFQPVVEAALRAGIPPQALSDMSRVADPRLSVTEAIRRIERAREVHALAFSSAVQCARELPPHKLSRPLCLRHILRTGAYRPRYLLEATFDAHPEGVEFGILMGEATERAYELGLKPIVEKRKVKRARSQHPWLQATHVPVASGEISANNGEYIEALDKDYLELGIISLSDVRAACYPRSREPLVVVTPSAYELIHKGEVHELETEEQLLFNILLILKGQLVSVRDMMRTGMSSASIGLTMAKLHDKLNPPNGLDSRRTLIRHMMAESMLGYMLVDSVALVDTRGPNRPRRLLK